MAQIQILNIKIDNLNFQEAVKKIEEFIESRRPHQVVTVNPEFIVESRRDAEFREILNSADLAIPDGIGLIYASRFLRMPLKERVTGVDLVWELAKHASEKKYSIYLLGSRPGIAQKAAARLKLLHKNLQIAGASEGVFFTEQHLKNKEEIFQSIIKDIRACAPDILLVAFGAPKQDKFIAAFKKELNVPVMIGVGGAFDFIAGEAKRAPLIFQKLGLEWLWRLFREPWRLRRIFNAVIVFPCLILIEKFRKS